MKKQFTTLLILSCLNLLFSKDCTKEVFKNYFDENLPTYEYNIRNPFFVKDFYITDLSKVKNSVIKVIKEEYEINNKGEKSYSDTDVRNVYNAYYKFDSDGRITDEYVANVTDNNFYYSKYHKKYYCNGNEYVIEFQDFAKEITSVEKYVITTENDVLLLTYSDGKETNEKSFTKDGYTEKRYRKTELVDLIENLINGNEITVYDYSLTDGKKKLWISRVYSNCLEKVYERYYPEKKYTYTYDFSENKENGYYRRIEKTKNSTSETILRRVNRKYDKNDFLIYEEEIPYEGTVGYYYFTSVENLKNYDEFFYNHFGDE